MSNKRELFSRTAVGKGMKREKKILVGMTK
jgi:hypothetical protein